MYASRAKEKERAGVIAKGRWSGGQPKTSGTKSTKAKFSFQGENHVRKGY